MGACSVSPHQFSDLSFPLLLAIILFYCAVSMFSPFMRMLPCLFRGVSFCCVVSLLFFYIFRYCYADIFIVGGYSLFF
jgi:hypothetical protein